METVADISSLLSDLRRDGIRIWLEGERLRFSAPSGALTPELRQELKDRKDEIRAFLLRAEHIARAETPPIRPIPLASRQQDLPLSFAQQRLWFVDQLENRNAAYNISSALELRGQLCFEAMRLSFQSLVQRHESLRTRFPAVDGRPRQEIDPPSEFRLPLVDLGGLPPERRRNCASRLAQDDAQRCFDLAQGPLIRACLILESEPDGPAQQSWILLVSMHHIVSDGWSLGVLVKELGAYYESLASDSGLASLPALPIQYADFASWQRSLLEESAIEGEVEYWRERLAGTEQLRLPYDRPRSRLRSFRGGRVRLEVPPQLSDRLRNLAKQRSATLFSSLVTCFAVYLHRLSGQTDICLGTPVANRTRLELEGLIGFFVNSLALRIDLAGDPGFSDLLDRVQTRAEEAFDHQELPFEKLLDALEITRDPSLTPIFQVMFALQSASTPALQLPGVTATPLEADNRTAKFDLTLSFSEEAQGGLTGSLEFNAQIFERTSIERMAEGLLNLLHAAAREPQKPISRLSILGRERRLQLLTEWNRTARVFPSSTCIHRRFEEQARVFPNAVAIVDGAARLTYSELNRRANRLAHFLRAQGVGPETAVAVRMQRSLQAVAAFLAILKAGGAYLPLDPSHPRERLDFMLQDAGAHMTLALRSGEVPAIEPPVLHLDDLEGELARQPETDLDGQASPLGAAYLMYTSGSTGRPKGICITHQAVLRLVCATDYLQAQPDEVVAHASNISFDAATFEIWAPLLNGGRLTVISRETLLSPAVLTRELREKGATAAFLTTALFNQIAQEQPSAFSGMRHLLVGGQQVNPDLMRRVNECGPPERLLNAYGPTECTTFATFCSMAAVDRQVEAIPIGLPIANTTLHLLDRHLEPVPIGAAGEIFLGGEGLSRGYLNRPAMTAAAFLPDPYEQRPGQRLYRTGDLARRRNNGQVEFLGRLDSQLKIRGFRIELSEVESVLAALPEISQCAVTAIEEESQEKRIVAYLVWDSAAHGDHGQLRLNLRERLPEYMLPWAFVDLEKLPLTPNGKVDRAALPAPERLHPIPRQEFAPPQTPQERVLAQIWGEVLGVAQVGVADNFFELGGDSILSIQIVSRAKKAGLMLTPTQVFTHQSVAELAQAAQPLRPQIAQRSDKPSGEMTLTPIQLWFFQQNLRDLHYFNQTVLLELRRILPPRLIAEAVSILVDRHDALRLQYRSDAGSWRQSCAVSGLGLSAVPLIDLSALPRGRRRGQMQWAATRLQAGLSLQGPIFRAALFDLGRGGRRLLLTVHHLAVDAVSWRILLEDLETACRQLAAGKSVSLGPATDSFGAWTRKLDQLARQHKGSDGEGTASADAIVRPLPVDSEEDSDLAGDERSVSVSLDPPRTQQLLKKVHAAYRTEINDLLLTALARALGSWQGSDEVCIDLESHGRLDLSGIDVSRTVGWFTLISPLRLRAGHGPSPAQDLKATKERLRALPLEAQFRSLMRRLRGEGGGPHPQVSFNYLGQLDQIFVKDAIFASAAEPAGPMQSPRNRRTHLLAVSAMVMGGRLRIHWHHNPKRHRRDTILSLAGLYLRELESLIDHCLSADAGGRTPSDFPLAGLDQAALDDLLSARQGVENLYPLAPLQQGMLFHSLYQSGEEAYFNQISCRIEGEIDLPAFETAWEAVLNRHESLRTCFAWEGLEQPLAIVQERVRSPIERHDWSRDSQALQESKRSDFLARDRRRSFDLGAAPLLRLAWIRLDDGQGFLVLSFHHAIMDGWSLPLVMGEVLETYDSLSQGGKIRFKPSPQYADFISWLLRQDRSPAESFWREQLAGFDSPTQLAPRLVGSVQADSEFGQESCSFSIAESDSLRQAAQRFHLTLNSLFQGAWALLLARSSGSDDVVFGVTVAGRPADLPGVEGMVGVFINTLPLRVRIAETQRVDRWLDRLQESQAQARRFEWTPLAQIQNWSGIERGRQLFESILVFENYPVGESLSAGLTPLRMDDFRVFDHTNYPLTLNVFPGDSLGMELAFRPSDFDLPAIQRMLSQVRRLLLSFVQEPQAQLWDLSLLSNQERRRLLDEWGRASADYPHAVAFPKLFERQAAQSPQAIAAVCGSQKVTYAQLNAHANRMSHHLSRQGLGPDCSLALLGERSNDFLTAIVAVLKCGGAYLPLDPEHPAARIAQVLERSQARLLLVQREMRARAEEAVARIAPERRPTILCLEDLLAWAGPEENPPRLAGPENLGYIIFTSGSTGAPKGAMVPMRAMVNHLWMMIDALALGPDDRIAQTASQCFDISVWQFLTPLTVGASVRIFPPAVSQDHQALLDAVESQGITVLEIVPTLMRLMMEEAQSRGADRPGLRQLRWLIPTAETLPPELCRDWMRLYPGIPLINAYGPSECADDISCHMLTEPPQESDASIPIGRPLGNVQLYVLDRLLRPLPVGIPGELCVAGISVGRGYLNDPARTAAAFIPDPFSDEPGERLYRSGDLAAWSARGELDFQGRIDFQVKIRGHRIELGEIEAALSQHPQVRQCLVRDWEDRCGARSLAAYVVGSPGEAIASPSLRSHLEARLPGYMIPRAFVQLDSFPLNANGKVDRKRLPLPQLKSIPNESAAPRGAVEETLTAIWREVLGDSRIGVEDNFFDLGGDSILSLQIAGRARRRGLSLSPKLIFEHQTIAQLARQVEPASGPAPLDEQGAVSGEAPLAPVQHWFFERGWGRMSRWNLPVLLEMIEPIAPSALDDAVGALLRHHDGLRSRFKCGADGWRQRVDPISQGVPFHLIDLTRVPAAQREDALRRSATQGLESLSLTRGPVFRACLLQLAEEPDQLLLAAHHLVVDGVSWRILLEDLHKLCRQPGPRRPARLAPKTTSFQRWSRLLQESAARERWSEQLSYWLEPSQAAAPLPLDRPQGRNLLGSERIVSSQLGASLTRELLQEAGKAYRNEINELLLTALAQTLCRWTGGRSLLLRLEGHGREDLFEDVDLSRTVGWFTSEYPVLLDLPPSASPGEALMTIKERLRGVPERGIGYGMLRYLGDPEASSRLQALPQPAIAFNYLGQFDQALPSDSAFSFNPEIGGMEPSPQGERDLVLEVNGLVRSGRLEVHWTYSSRLHREETIRRLADDYLRDLTRLVEHCLAPGAGGYAPSDFPLAELSRKQLDRLPVRPSDLEDLYPLSPVQEGMLFHTLYEEESDVYIDQLSILLGPGSDDRLFEQAWKRVAQERTILRSSVLWEGLERPLQAVRRRHRAALERLDWSGLPQEREEDQLTRFLQSDRRRGFELAQGPLMRLSWIRLSGGRARFVWSCHHLLLDGWSVPLVMEDVLSAYRALRQGREPRLKTRRPFSHYISWLQGLDAAAAKDFWRRRLEGIDEPTPIPLSRPPAPQAGNRQRRIVQPLEQETILALQDLAKSNRLTVSTLALGAWALLLSRYSGKNDVLFGVTVSGRNWQLEGISEMIGLFINTLPARVRLGPESQLVPWLQQLQKDRVEADRFSATPLVAVQAASQIAAGRPLFESILLFENYPMGKALDDRDLPLDVRELGVLDRNNYPLTAEVQPGEGLEIGISWDTHRFESKAVEAMLGHLRTLLESFAADPQGSPSQMPMFTRAERLRLLQDAAGPSSSVPEVLIHQAFEIQAARRPEAAAIHFRGQRFSYGDLEREAQGICLGLRRQGVSQGSLVALHCQRGPEMVAAILGILKAGAAYLPLDPRYPRQRLSGMLQDSGAGFILVGQGVDELPLPNRELSRMGLSRFGSATAPQTCSDPAPHNGARDRKYETSCDELAYVIYTSGSTGRPKGVAITHRSWMNLLLAFQRLTPLAEDGCMLGMTPLSFDISAMEIALPWLSGASLSLAASDEVGDTDSLIGLIDAGVTVAQTTPSGWQLLLDGGWRGNRKLTAISGGEALPRALALRIQERVSELINGYGPTETTIWSAAYSCPLGLPGEPEPVRLGQPLVNTGLYILDRELRPVPKGIPGMLYIGGSGLARGYLNRPSLTARKYLPDPVSGCPGQRIYQTGDVVRRRCDGALEFLGRADHQVKVRGHRIELGEVEGALMTYPGVTEAVALVRNGNGASNHLAAVIRAERGSQPTLASLRDHLRRQLPEYMVPSAYAFVERMPLTPSGKTDRKALSSVQASNDETASTTRLSPLEELVANIWCDVLGLEQVGKASDFFQLGGHSLLATQAVVRLRSAAAADLPVRALFEAPTVAGLARRLEDARRRPKTPAAGLATADRQGRLELSFPQRRLWFLDRLAPGGSAYILFAPVRLRGVLDVESLRRAFEEVCRRHEILRTTFAETDGEPHQIIHRPPLWKLPCVDLEGLSEEATRRELARAVGRESQRPFDLQRDLPLRTTLLRSALESVLMVAMHHIASDGWSIGVLVGEIAALYRAFSQGSTSPLVPLPRQYADFAQWQRHWMESAELERQLRYWKDRLAEPTPLQLPLDRPRTGVRFSRGGRLDRRLVESFSKEISGFSRKGGSTLFMTLAAAYASLLQRYSGSDDICIGFPVANRTLPQTEPLIGFFVNTLPLRCDLSGDPSFEELLGRVRETALQAYEHQDVPFERLVEGLEVERGPGRMPLVQNVLAVQNAPFEPMRLDQLEIAPLASPPSSVQFDLTLFASEQEGSLHLSLEYAADLFEKPTASRILDHFLRILKGAVESPESRLSHLPMLSRQEQRMLLSDCNQTQAETPDACIHELFRRQARRNPDAIALVGSEFKLSYRELDQQSDRLAQRLLQLDLPGEARLGVCLERTPQAIAAVLAILKAGGAYLPLDPKEPEQRLHRLAQDARIAALVTDSGRSSRWTSFAGPVVLVDRDDEPPVQARSRPQPRTSADSLAYVIYTSGSTGRPKGVAVSHRSIVRLLFGVDYAELDSGRVILQAAPLAFDASTFEIWGALLHGGRLALLPPGTPTAQSLAQAIRAHEVDTLWLTASLFNAVVDEQVEALEGIRQLLAGGESLSIPHLRRYRRRFGQTRLVNGYGPTEGTTFTCCHPIPERLEDGLKTVPIGRPIANTSVYLLDAWMRPVALGVTGHLFIGGEGLARGYLERPRATAQAFVPDPCSGQPGRRLYRSGDLARRRSDGTIEFLGREDAQVKLRGFRIELGEIEAALAQIAGVRQSAVVLQSAREGECDDKRIVAYVACDPAAGLDAASIHLALSRSLPDYMAPSALALETSLPLTKSGKVDRQRLPCLAPSGGDGSSPLRTPTESLLADMWRSLLGTERVSADSDFFELGGHSLLAMRMVSRIREAFQVELTVASLFESTRLSSLAARIDEARRRGRRLRLPPLKARRPIASDGGRRAASLAQQRMWFLERLRPGSLMHNLPIALALDGALDVEALRRTFQGIASRHEVLRTSFAQEDGQCWQRIAPGAAWRLPLIDLAGLPQASQAEESQRLIAQEAKLPFDLSQAPLMRTSLLRLADRRHVLSASLHHLVSDGWSTGVLVEEISALYASCRESAEAALPRLNVQYGDFADWQRRWLQDEDLSRQSAYWRRQLAAAPVLRLQSDHDPAGVPQRRGAELEERMPRKLAEDLLKLSRQQGVTLFMTLLSAYGVLLQRFSGQEDICVGSPIANRNTPQLERLIGLFLNTLVLRLQLAGNPSFQELLRRVRAATLDAYDHQDLPFDQLVDELGIKRNADRMPLYGAWFVLQNAPAERLDLPQLTLRPMKTPPTVAKVDLAVSMHEGPEGLSALFTYDRDLFEPSTAGRMSGFFRNLLEEIASRPQASLRELSEAASRRDEKKRSHRLKERGRSGLQRIQSLRRRPSNPAPCDSVNGLSKASEGLAPQAGSSRERRRDEGDQALSD